jgi:hypothetical protein
MPCLLIIRGSNLELDKVLALVSFTPYATHRRGDAIKRKPGQSHDDSCLRVEVSSSWNGLQQQCREAEEFLQKHSKELHLIEGADSLQLDFAYDSRIGTGEGGEEIAVQCDYIPVSLVKACGELSIGIALTQFAPQEEGNKDDGDSPS